VQDPLVIINPKKLTKLRNQFNDVFKVNLKKIGLSFFKLII
jgi:hypothetical protein